jgi:molybdopterin-binding protein
MSISAINAKNQFKSKISAITLGTVVSEVGGQTPDSIVASVNTTSSVRDLGLEIGTGALATDVSLAKL